MIAAKDNIRHLPIPRRIKMMMYKVIIMAGILAFCIMALDRSGHAHETERFMMLETKEGVLRLDKQNGAIDTCLKKDEKWQCRPITETNTNYKPETNELDQESQDIISDLRLKNLKLRQRIADLEAKQSLNSKEAPPEDEQKLKLPTDEEVDEAISYMEKMIRKFRGAMNRLRKEHEQELPGTEL